MKFATAKEHRDFFQKKGWIEFEGFVTADELIQIQHAIEEVLAQRLKGSSLEAEQQFQQGRDLWRDHPLLKKFVTQRRLAEIASELVEKKPLRLGYDQFLPLLPSLPRFEIPRYAHFLEQQASLESVSCIQGVLGGVILALENKKSVDKDQTSEGMDIFPKQKGNVIFFQSTLPIAWHRLKEIQKNGYYLIVYAQSKAHYILQPQDPQTHYLKRLGYVFNDKLNDRLHPYILR